jgi:hypothetical protein
MLVALIVAGRRSMLRGPVSAPVHLAPEPPSRHLLRRLATLDEEFEKIAAPDDTTRSAYEAKRAALKSQFAEVLAEERRPT